MESRTPYEGWCPAAAKTRRYAATGAGTLVGDYLAAKGTREGFSVARDVEFQAANRASRYER